MTKTVQTSETRLRAVRIALALAIVLVPAVFATRSAEAQSFKVLYTFTGGADGGDPYDNGSLLQYGNSLFGTTTVGGAYGYGTVFEVASTGGETVLYSFTGGKDGAYPYAGLIPNGDGGVYGTTEAGGAHGYGTVFEVASTGGETVLYSFTGGKDGAYPYASLVRDPKGNLHGTTEAGGAYGYGTAFMLNTKGKETWRYSFAGTPDGEHPYAGLIQHLTGALYGTTYQGGTYGYGTVFEVDGSGKETVLYSFTGTSGDGANPFGGLFRDKGGDLYGTTQRGGYLVSGTVFKLNANGTETVPYTFSGTPDGASPYAGLVPGAKGNFYGTTFSGGAYGDGTVFKVTKYGKYLRETVLYSFTGGADGAKPVAGLVRDAAGNLYGTTTEGGTYGYGTVFELTP